MYSNRSPSLGANHGEERNRNITKKSDESNPSRYSHDISRFKIFDESINLLRLLFMSTGVIDSKDTAAKGRIPSFDIHQELVQIIQSYLGENFNSPTTESRLSPTNFGIYTPVTALASSGPLKMRLKKRYSLDNISSLLFTPPGFYNFTPDLTIRNDDKLVSNNKIQVSSFRTSCTNVTQKTVSEVQNHKSANKKIQRSGFAPSTKKSKRIDSERGISHTTLNNIVSIPRVKSEETTAFAMGLIHQVKLPQNNHKELSPFVLPRSSKPNLSTFIAPTFPLNSVEARPTTMLPTQSPRFSKKNLGIHRTLEPSSASVCEENQNNYMRFVRQQFEFFELGPEDVALCESRDVAVELGQVALRCRHCTCISVAFRPKGSLVIARMHRSLYRFFEKGINSHLEELCPFVPKSTKKKLASLRLHNTMGGNSTLSQDFQYWCEVAKAEGVVETKQGLRFKSSLMIANSYCRSPLQSYAKKALYPTIRRNQSTCSGMVRSLFSPLAINSGRRKDHGRKRCYSIQKSLVSTHRQKVSKKQKTTADTLPGMNAEECGDIEELVF